MSITSLPVVPVQPSQGVFKSADLALFPRFTRESYFQKYGVQAPPWDPKRRIKRWLDTSHSSLNPSDIVSYNVFALTNEAPGFKKIAMTVETAASVNLPGLVSYPKYVPAPTEAYVIADAETGARNQIDGGELCTKEEAAVLASELGGVHELSSFDSAIVYPATEQRRKYSIRRNGQVFEAGLLLLEKYANGVGAPGKWNFDGAEPNWISDVVQSGEQDPRAEVEFPSRPLLPNERFFAGPFGHGVYRTDIPSEYNTPTPGTGGGGLTSEQSKVLLEIQGNVKKLVDLALTQ